MARFIYKGEAGAAHPKNPNNPLFTQRGPTLAIVFHTQHGQKLRLDAPNQTTGFVVGQDIGVSISDPRVLRHLRHDPRFQEITTAPVTAVALNRTPTSAVPAGSTI